jgi:glycosyltransferase involved in cell wall biosynthesis
MKILHIIDSGGLYGAEVMLINLMVAQQAMGLTPVLVSIGTPDCGSKAIERQASEKGLTVVPYRMQAGLNVSGARALCRLGQREKATLFHSHGYKGNILLGLLPFSGRTLPLISTVHGWTWTGQLNRMMVYEWLDAFSLRRIDHVVVVNKLMLQHRRVRSLPAMRLSMVHNGMDFSANISDASCTLPSNHLEFLSRRFTVVSVGRFSEEKGLVTLVHVIGDLIRGGHDLQLLLLGDGGLRGPLTSLTASLGITDRVFMPGHVSNVLPYLRRCQVFAMPSLTEGLPMALLEAMYAEIPIVASRVGGIPEALLDGRAGMLIAPGQPDDLKQAIQHVYGLPTNLSAMVQLAKQHVQSEFSARSMAEKYLRIYEQVTTSAARA